MPFDPWNTDDGFPDDWFQPPSSSAPGTAQPTFGASPNPFNPLLTSAPPSSFSPFGAQPTFNPRQSPFNPVFTNLLPPSHPLSPYFGLSPDEWVRAQALVAPTFPDAFGQFPRPSPLPPPPPIATSALFGDLTRRLLERTAPAPIGLFGNTAWHPAEVGDAPSISGGGQFDSLANRQPAALSSQANAPFAPPSDAFASQSFIPPASLALSTTPPTFSAQPDPINPLLATLALPPFDLFSLYRSSPRSPLGAAWLPPTFPDAFGRTQPPLPTPPPGPLPTGSTLGDSAWGFAEGRGTTPTFGGGPFASPTIQPPPTSSLQASAPSLASSYRPAALPFKAPDLISYPGDTSLYSYLRSNLSYSNSGALHQSQLRINENPDAVSDTSAESGDPNLILVGDDREGDPPDKFRPIDPLTGLPERRLPDSQKPLPTPPAPLEDGSLPAPTAKGAPTSPTALGRSYELRKGSRQFTLRVPFRGKEITIRLDYPPDEDGIVDLKDYNWWKPGYIRPFLQKVVANNFQEQIQKYQAAHPDAKFKFSQQPPPWVVQAIEQVGGTYIVDP